MTGRMSREMSTAAEYRWAIGYRPSNGTDGGIFQSQWCDHCHHDHINHGPDGVTDTGCTILAAAFCMTGTEGPIVWLSRRNSNGVHQTMCTEFEDCGPCNEPAEQAWPSELPDRWRPPTVAHVPGQLGLLP